MVIHRVLEKYSVLFTLGCLVLISYFQAAGISLLVEAALDQGTPSRGRAVSAAAPPPRRKTADAIIRRNPFDSVAGPLGGPVDFIEQSAPAIFANVGPLSAPECDSPQVVIVTESRDPAWSIAALQTATDHRPRNHRIGDQVAGKTVEFIGYNPAQSAPSVWLSSAGGLCQTLLFQSRPKVPSAPTNRSSAPASTPAVGTAAGALLGHVRVVPERSGGTIVGIRLFGIRADSLLGSLGLENGDRLESINGFALGTPEQALGAYARLRTATRLVVSINRRGTPITLAYRID